MTETTASFKDFSISEMQRNGDAVRGYANQSDNPLLRSLALEVIETAGRR